MDKYEYQQKLDEVIRLVREGQYVSATEIADEMDWVKEKDAKKLTIVSKAYEKCRRYQDAEELLLQALRYAPMGRSIVFHLCTLSLKLGNVSDAEMYYKEFCELSPRDSQRHILEYRIALAKNASNADLIAILEKYKDEDFDEQWGYRLAELYAMNGEDAKCIELCNDIQLWFGDGPYVMKALKLKSQFCECTPDEMKKLEDMEASENNARLEVQRAEEEAKQKAEAEAAAKAEEEARRQAEAEAAAKAEEEARRQAEAEAEAAAKAEEEARLQAETEAAAKVEAEVTVPAEEVTVTTPAEEEVAATAVTEEDRIFAPPVNKKKSKKNKAAQMAAAAATVPVVAAVAEGVAAKTAKETTAEVTEAVAETPAEETVTETVTETPVEETVAETVAETPVKETVAETAAETPEKEMPLEEQLGSLMETPVAEPSIEEKLAAVTEMDEEVTEKVPSITEKLAAVTAMPVEEKTSAQPITGTVKDAVREAVKETAAATSDTETEATDLLNQATKKMPAVTVPGTTIEMPVVSMQRMESSDPEDDIVVATLTEAKKTEGVQEPAVAEKTVDIQEPSFPDGLDLSDVKPTVSHSVGVYKNDSSSDGIITEPTAKPAKKTVRIVRDETIAIKVSDVPTAEEDADVSVEEAPKARTSEFGHLPVNPKDLEYVWHFMVYGDNKDLNVNFAIEKLREMSSVKLSMPGTMVKATGNKINNLGVMQGIDRFLGKMVLVQDAGALTTERLKEFSQVLEDDDRSLLVVFMDTKANIKKMLQQVPELEVPFSAVFRAKKYTAEELVEHGVEFAERQGARFSVRAEQMLEDKAVELLAENQGDFKKDMEDYISVALENAEKKNGLGLAGLLGGKTDKEGYLIIKEKHFGK